ncbi:MAG: hypothetical protein AAGK22_15145 [Acidobacteriota bacterium]
MSQRGRRASDWTLDPEAFGRFLALLDDDVVEAAHLYERLRHKLIRLFEWRGCAVPEELADETLNRVIRKIDEGAEVPTERVAGYSVGVARFVFQEYLRQRRAETPAAPERERPPFVPGKHTTTDLRLGMLEDCLDRLSHKERDLIVRYYDHAKGGQIVQRRALAAELGVAANTLRIRVHRIRAKLLHWMIDAGLPASEETGA